MITQLYDYQIPQELDTATQLPIGPLVESDRAARVPEHKAIQGRYCTLEPLDIERHIDDLYAAKTTPDALARFRYLPDNPPESKAQLTAWLEQATASTDPLFFAVIDNKTGRAEGRQTLMRIQPEQQSIEIGHIYWGAAIARSRVTTEATYLFAQYAFEELGYRRYEWKCDALNAASRRAALRFGFQFEGHFRRAALVNGRSRDTTWFAIIREDWPALKSLLENWLSEDNFTHDGQQRTRLSEQTRTLLALPTDQTM